MAAARLNHRPRVAVVRTVPPVGAINPGPAALTAESIRDSRHTATANYGLAGIVSTADLTRESSPGGVPAWHAAPDDEHSATCRLRLPDPRSARLGRRLPHAPAGRWERLARQAQRDPGPGLAQQLPPRARAHAVRGPRAPSSAPTPMASSTPTARSPSNSTPACGRSSSMCSPTTPPAGATPRPPSCRRSASPRSTRRSPSPASRCSTSRRSTTARRARRLTDCLGQIRAWSDAHPGHLPITVQIEAKDDTIPDPGLGFVTPLPWSRAAFARARGRDRRRVPRGSGPRPPPTCRGRSATLRDAVLAGRWPRLDAVRGQVLFVLDDKGAKRDAYRAEVPDLADRSIFVDRPRGTTPTRASPS